MATTPTKLTTPNLTDLVSCVQLTGALWPRSVNPSVRADFGVLRGLGGVCPGLKPRHSMMVKPVYNLQSFYSEINFPIGNQARSDPGLRRSDYL